MAIAGPVLVTGAAGCIGAQVVANLSRGGIEPIVFDVSDNRRRLQLSLDEEDTAAVRWIVGDLRDKAAVEAVMADHKVAAVVHLAALQVPFCNADPVLGAQVDVVGQVNVFEAVRKLGIRRLVYASSVAALPPADAKWPATLYGVYKLADEGIADVYWRTWNVPSIGIRPHSVYGPGRDQGVTAAPSKAMLAAAAGRRFTIPYDGTIMMQHVAEVADAFIRAAGTDVAGATVFDLRGEDTTVREVVAAIRRFVPDAKIKIGDQRMPFVAGLTDSGLRQLVGDWHRIGLDEGVERTVTAFRVLIQRGLVAPEDAYLGVLGAGHDTAYDS
ncbi:MAG: NAD-dependent epimerase/dehydratase family protein [Alphaproteobacteria bacterium]|nr:NAD-dependent epimerase/dehydratase family protein [Alphaproteobacteria bacterium]